MRISNGETREYKRAINRERQRPLEGDASLARLAAFEEYICEASRTNMFFDEPSIVQNRDMQIPTGRRQHARLVRVLNEKGTLHLVAPVCPPTLRFDGTFKPAISAEAEAALRAAHFLTGEFAGAIGIEATVTIMVADTEDDIEHVAEAIGKDAYRNCCSDSAEMIDQQLRPAETVTTFSSYFDAFHDRQYEREVAVTDYASRDSGLYDLLASVVRDRTDKHAVILGRPEQNMELAVRYAAQYAVMGQEIRSDESPFDAALSYQTPNLQFLNHALAGEGTIPVFETRRCQ